MLKLIMIKTYNLRAEAELDKSLLEAEGIKSIISSDGSGLSHVTLFTGQTQLLVKEKDKEEASQILGDNI
jgi:hypothetical protein